LESAATLCEQLAGHIIGKRQALGDGPPEYICRTGTKETQAQGSMAGSEFVQHGEL